MADLKFSCPQCGQHISCDELWSGHQIQCPVCQTSLTVPQALVEPASAAPAPTSLVPQPPASSRAKLSAGVTQVARSTPAGAIPQKRAMPRSPKTSNPALKYAVIAVLLIVIGGAAFVYLPGLLSQVQDMGNSKTSAPTASSGGGGVGPMGEVNGTMDVSDALDGGGGASRPRASAKPATNPAPKSANSPLRNR
jgi:hypothetical protein